MRRAAFAQGGQTQHRHHRRHHRGEAVEVAHQPVALDRNLGCERMRAHPGTPHHRRGFDAFAAAKRRSSGIDSGDGVAILTDMFGGTPSNLAISCMSRPKVEVLAGINLPMLVKLAKVREERSLPDAIAMAQEAGRKYVTIASRVLAGK